MSARWLWVVGEGTLTAYRACDDVWEYVTESPVRDGIDLASLDTTLLLQAVGVHVRVWDPNSYNDHDESERNNERRWAKAAWCVTKSNERRQFVASLGSLVYD